MCIYMHMYMCVYLYLSLSLSIYIYIYRCVYIYIYIYTHTYTLFYGLDSVGKSYPRGARHPPKYGQLPRKFCPERVVVWRTSYQDDRNKHSPISISLSLCIYIYIYI